MPLPKGFVVAQDGAEVVLAISPTISFRFDPQGAEALSQALEDAAHEARLAPKSPTPVPGE
jgi:hypothetical protein